MCPKRNMHEGLRNEVAYLDAVAAGPHSGGATDAHPQVGQQPAGVSQRQPGLPGQRGVRSDADAQDDDVGREDLASGDHAGDAAT
jgi:hypothetical protein